MGEFGDVEDRKALRDSLQCKSFEWYLKNQMPHFLENKIIGAGEIRNFHWNFCLDQQDTEHNTGRFENGIFCVNRNVDLKQQCGKNLTNKGCFRALAPDHDLHYREETTFTVQLCSISTKCSLHIVLV